MAEQIPFWKTLPKLSVLWLFLPVTIGLQLAGNEGLALFLVAALGILGTVTLIAKGTEEIAIYAGPLWGGLLNATFGNVTELIIALFALNKGLHAVVLSSITGSILGNLLLVLGGAMVYGGAKYHTQKFSRTGANVNVGMLWVTIVIIMVPSLMDLAVELEHHEIAVQHAEASEREMAAEPASAQPTAEEEARQKSMLKNISISGAASAYEPERRRGAAIHSGRRFRSHVRQASGARAHRHARLEELARRPGARIPGFWAKGSGLDAVVARPIFPSSELYSAQGRASADERRPCTRRRRRFVGRVGRPRWTRRLACTRLARRLG
jgi:hypothetical protein